MLEPKDGTSANFSALHLDYIKSNDFRYLGKPFEIDAFHQFIDSMVVTESDQTLLI